MRINIPVAKKKRKQKTIKAWKDNPSLLSNETNTKGYKLGSNRIKIICYGNNRIFIAKNQEEQHRDRYITLIQFRKNITFKYLQKNKDTGKV